MSKDVLTIKDERTGKTYEVPIEHGTVRATEFLKIAKEEGKTGLRVFDPAFMNTASCKSEVSFINGDAGILRYRGYPIQELAEKCDFLSVAFLLLEGELPTPEQKRAFEAEVLGQMEPPAPLQRLLEGFRPDAHPMSMMMSLVAALGTYYDDYRDVSTPEARRRSTIRLVAQVPTLAGWVWRYRKGQSPVRPNPALSYEANFLHMVFGKEAAADPVLERVISVLFTLHAEHELNCGTHTARSVASAHTDPFSVVSAATAALFGPLHGGANEAVLKMLDEIGSVENIPSFLEKVKQKEAKLMGFGHRVYKFTDPRRTVLRAVADEVFKQVGHNPKIELALALEQAALKDDYFQQRNLYANVDFLSGVVYEALGFEPDFFTVLFMVPRTVGWLAHMEELHQHAAEQKIARPRQIYLGHAERHID